jgi:23S rRNA (cytosine1962-C5)-methyltransferase
MGKNGMYRLLDSGGFQKLEQVGEFRMVRPAAQAVWRPRLSASEWTKVDAIFTRFSGGDGRWEVRNRKLPESWIMEVPGLGALRIRLTDFGHLGIFPEQHANWQRLAALVEARKATVAGGELRVLNLFAYTGGSTLAAARGGAHVAHVDASKTSVAWARENAEAAGLSARPIRWLVDDVQKFVAREVRRGIKYHGVILDPPSYGRGPRGEAWKIEEMLPELLDGIRQLLADDYVFVLLSGHSGGYTPVALTNLLAGVVDPGAGSFDASEMLVTEDGADPSGFRRQLPSGAHCWFIRGPR